MGGGEGWGRRFTGQGHHSSRERSLSLGEVTSLSSTKQIYICDVSQPAAFLAGFPKMRVTFFFFFFCREFGVFVMATALKMTTKFDDSLPTENGDKLRNLENSARKGNFLVTTRNFGRSVYDEKTHQKKSEEPKYDVLNPLPTPPSPPKGVGRGQSAL